MSPDVFARLIAPLRRRVQMMVGRAVISAVDDGPQAQALQLELLEDEVIDDAERFESYGLSSVPLPGAEAAVVFVGGLRSHPLVVGVVDRRHRPRSLEPGEVALFDDQGQRATLARDGVRISTPLAASIDAEGALELRAAGGGTIEAGAALTLSSGGPTSIDSAGPVSIGGTALAIDAPVSMTTPLDLASGGTGVADGAGLLALLLGLGLAQAGSTQPNSTLLSALAAMGEGAGLVEQTGAAAFAKRPIGAATAASILSRGDGDARYQAALGFVPTSIAGLTGEQTIAAIKAALALVKGDVGLGNADNTSDALKPISAAAQAALDLKAPLASPALTGLPTAPTAAAADNSTKVATTAFVQGAIADLIAMAPGSLNTLDELAAAMGDDPNFAATVTTALAGKLDKASNLSDLTDAAAARANLALGNVENKSSATIRSELTAGNVTGALGYTPTSVTGLTGSHTVVAFKTGLALAKGDVGLGNADNTSDANKPVSTAQAAAIALKANIASPSFTGTVTATNATQPLVVNGTGQNGKLRIQHGGADRGIWGANATNAFIVINGANTAFLFSVRDSGQIVFDTPPVDAANDAAAAVAGVPVNGLYRNGSALMVRVA